MYRKKPVMIEAIRWEGDQFEFFKFSAPFNGVYMGVDNSLIIPTLEGMMEANIGDWIIKGVNGEFYPCKNDVFLISYEKVEKE